MSKTREMSGAGGRGRMARSDALNRAKLALAAARERGEPDALAQALRANPAQADALSDFAMALTATESYQGEELTPDVLEVAAAARVRAFTAVFGSAQAVMPAAQAVSLKALRQARGVTLTTAAAALSLGVDVLSALEAGRIRVASAPRRLTEALGALLDTTADQISAALGAQVAPAFRRGAIDAAQTHAAPETSAQLDFADAVLLSQSMTAGEKAGWLADSSGLRATH